MLAPRQALGDTDIVFPLPRYPDAPRSRATLVGEALPLTAGFDLTVDEVEERVVARDPVQVATAVRRFFEGRKLTVLVVDGGEPGVVGRLKRAERIEKELGVRVPSHEFAVEITEIEDPLLRPGDYAIAML
jgi:hypothetical protein